MPRFGGPVVSSTSSGKTKLSTSNSMSCIQKVAHGQMEVFIVFCICVIYIKCQDLVVQLSVVL